MEKVYIIKARWWHAGLQEQFGQEGFKHKLTSDEIVSLIHESSFGRAVIRLSNELDVSILEFQNDYD